MKKSLNNVLFENYWKKVGPSSGHALRSGMSIFLIFLRFKALNSPNLGFLSIPSQSYPVQQGIINKIEEILDHLNTLRKVQ